MSQANLFIRRTGALRTVYNPDAPGVTNKFLSFLSLAIALGNHRVASIPPLSTDLRVNWPNPTVIPYTTEALGAGIRAYRYRDGNAEEQTLNVAELKFTTALSARIARTGEPTYALSILKNLLGWNLNQQFLHGISTALPLGVPSSEFVDVNGTLQKSDIFASTLADYQGYDYAQITNANAASQVFKNLLGIDSVLRAPYPNVTQMVPFVVPLATSWGTGIGDSFLQGDALHSIDLGLTVDPNLLIQEQDANSDLYITIPASLSNATSFLASAAFASEVALPGAPGFTNGAYVTVAVPLSYLKTLPNGRYVDDLVAASPDPADPGDWTSRVLTGAATTAPAATETWMPIDVTTKVVMGLSPISGVNPPGTGTPQFLGPINF